MKNQKKILWTSIIIIALLFALELNKGIVDSSIGVSNAIKGWIADFSDATSDFFNKHIAQADEIERLKIVEEQKNRQDIEIMAMNDILGEILPLIDAKPKIPSIHLVRAFSYVNMGQYSQVWLREAKSRNAQAKQIQDSPLSQNVPSKVFGLIKGNYAAGIAMIKNGRLLGILNGDSKLSYGVYIGDEKHMGILKSSPNGDTIIEYIHAWSEIKVGDEITTSGLDGIFFEGIKVGVVKNVRQEYGYIVVDVELYAKNDNIGYFWLVDVDSEE